MKFILVLLAVVALVWLLRGSVRRRGARPPRTPSSSRSSPPAADAAGPRPILACAFCGVHLPKDEALPGRGGVFCDAAHRAAFEKAHPDS